MIAMINIEACKSMPAPSIATEPMAAVTEYFEWLRTINARAVTREAKVINNCEEALAARGAKASISTPISAPPSTTKIGASNR